MNRRSDACARPPYNPLQNPAAPIAKRRAAALKCACVTTGPDCVRAIVRKPFRKTFS
ncbi:hypothetical protein BVI434_2080002 [Burkholderia vietnamiensis]|nr:hypothetical protein BVI434_2080002 [Burkholderia vietnamiensis]